MNRIKKLSYCLLGFFFLATISLDSIAHITHIDADHELECPFSNNKPVEAELTALIDRIDVRTILIDAFTQSFYYKTKNSLFLSRAPPRI